VRTDQGFKPVLSLNTSGYHVGSYLYETQGKKFLRSGFQVSGLEKSLGLRFSSQSVGFSV